MKWGCLDDLRQFLWLPELCCAPPKPHPPQFGNTGSLCFINHFVSIVFFSVELTSNFAEKAEKAHATECYIGNKSFNRRAVRMRSRYMSVCEDGTECVWAVVTHCSSTQWSEIKQYVTNVLVTSFLNEQATVHGKQPQKHCIWVFLEMPRFRHPLNVLHTN